MNYLLGRSSHLRLCVPRLCAPAKSNLAYPYAGARSNPCFPCKARRLNTQNIIHQHPVKRAFWFSCIVTSHLLSTLRRGLVESRFILMRLTTIRNTRHKLHRAFYALYIGATISAMGILNATHRRMKVSQPV